MRGCAKAFFARPKHKHLSEIILTIDTVDPVDLFGDKNRNLSLVQEAYPDTRITQRGNSVRISGEKRDTQAVKNRIEMMVRLLKEHHELPTQTVEDLLAGENPFATKLGRGNGNKTIVHSRTGRPIKAKTKNQQVLVDTAGQNDIVFEN